MRLTTYKTCSFQEKRAVLRTFWSGRASNLDKINLAAREYGPYALALVAIITLELVVIAALLIARANGWAWVSTSAFVLSLWSLWWTTVCRQKINASTASSNS